MRQSKSLIHCKMLQPEPSYASKLQRLDSRTSKQMGNKDSVSTSTQLVALPIYSLSEPNTNTGRLQEPMSKNELLALGDCSPLDLL
jgi:hypothetical protein